MYRIDYQLKEVLILINDFYHFGASFHAIGATCRNREKTIIKKYEQHISGEF